MNDFFVISLTLVVDFDEIFMIGVKPFTFSIIKKWDLFENGLNLRF